MTLHVDPSLEDAFVVEVIQRLQRRRAVPRLSSYEFAKSYRRFPLPIPAFHRPWYDGLDRDDRLLLLAPREHAKTSVVLTYALHRLACDRQVRIGIISGTDDLARAFLRDLKRELRDNPQLITDFGGHFYEPGLKWTEHEIVVLGADHGKDVSVFCASAGAQITGRHCDLLIFDDIETTDGVQTPEVRSKTRAWFAKEALPLLSPRGKAIVVGTRKHDDDLYATLIRAAQGDGADDEISGPQPWRFLDNAISVFKEETGEAIWPERWSKEALLQRKAELDAVDIRAWSQEYLNRPLPSETQMFWPSDWPAFDLLPEGVVHLQAWDLAISSRQIADYTAGVDIAIDRHNNVYIVDCMYGHWDFHSQQERVRAFAARHRPQLIAIEAVQYQAAAVQELVRTSMLPVMRVHPSQKGLKGGKVTIARDKVSRAQLLEARAAERKVWRPRENTPWWSELFEELLYFPLGRHDDLVDALVYAVTLAARENWNWALAYSVYWCKRCGKGYTLVPSDRPCPFCWAKPEFDGWGDLYLYEEAKDVTNLTS